MMILEAVTSAADIGREAAGRRAQQGIAARFDVSGPGHEYYDRDPIGNCQAAPVV